MYTAILSLRIKIERDRDVVKPEKIYLFAIENGVYLTLDKEIPFIREYWETVECRE